MEYEVWPSDMGITTVKLLAGTGSSYLEGVVARPVDGENPWLYRRLELSSSVTLMLEEEQLAHTHTFRAPQASEHFHVSCVAGAKEDGHEDR